MFIGIISFPIGIWIGSVDKALYCEWWVTSLVRCNVVFAVVVD